MCCVALAFDRSPLFAYDKPAGEPCANLSATGRCAIHTERAAKGFAGCEAYDCLGAGQAVTQGQARRGRSWRDDPALLRADDGGLGDTLQMLPAREALAAAAAQATGVGRMPLPAQARAGDWNGAHRAGGHLDPARGWMATRDAGRAGASRPIWSVP